MSKPEEIAQLTATITQDFDKEFVELFNLEIEIMQGRRTVLPDGRIEYKLSISDLTKQEMIKEFILKVISQSHKQNKN